MESWEATSPQHERGGKAWTRRGAWRLPTKWKTTAVDFERFGCSNDAVDVAVVFCCCCCLLICILPRTEILTWYWIYMYMKWERCSIWLHASLGDQKLTAKNETETNRAQFDGNIPLAYGWIRGGEREWLFLCFFKFGMMEKCQYTLAFNVRNNTIYRGPEQIWVNW